MNHSKYFISALMLIAMYVLFSAFRSHDFVASEKWIAPPDADKLKNPLPYTDENILAGKKLFEGVCWTCHGMDGKGNGPASLPLDPKPADFSIAGVQSQTDGAIFWKISIGRGAMVPFSQSLTANQRWQLVCFLRSFRPGNEKSSIH